MPTWGMVKKIKRDKNEEEYWKEYILLLVKRFETYDLSKGLVEVLEDFIAKNNIIDDITLCCWCKPGRFCHRRIICGLLPDEWKGSLL
jgi:hypothetical protein